MRSRFPILTVTFAVLGVAAFAAGCSSSGGTGSTTPIATAPPTSAPTLSSQYNTMGNITCTAPNNALPGYYTTVITNGTVVGSTYTATDQGFNGYQLPHYVAAQSTSAPTTPPLAPATPVPSATPGALGILYYGEYSVPAFTDESNGTPTPIDATVGCFQFETNQPVGGTVGEAKRGAPLPDTTSAPNAQGYGIGYATFSAPYPTSDTYVGAPGAGSYALTTFTITNLTRTTGSGTFVFPINGSSASVTGTVTITGSTTFPASAPNEDTSVKRFPQLLRH